TERTFASRYSADVALAISMFVTQALAEHTVVEIAQWLTARVRSALGHPRRGGPPPVLIEVRRFKADSDSREVEGLKVSGGDIRIVEIVMSYLRGDSRPE